MVRPMMAPAFSGARSAIALALFAGAFASSCRGNFEEHSAEVPDAAPDAPLPELVCAAQASPIPALGGNLAQVDLAVTSQDLRYLAAWTDPATGSVSLAELDRTRSLLGQPHVVIPSGVSRVAGLEATPDRIWMVTAAPPAQSVWHLSADLTSPVTAITETSIPGVESIAVATTLNARPIWARGGFDDNSIRLSYLMSNGDVGAYATFAAEGKVVELSFADYTNHAHLAWRLAGGRCYGSDIIFGTAPGVPNAGLLTEDCAAIRAVSGPAPHDPLVVAWATNGGDIYIRYDGATLPDGGTRFTAKVGSGRAPKITFDGQAYWVAWRDETGQLRFARVDQAGGFKTSGVLGYAPVSDESFELVARGVAVDLVLLDKEKLSFLTLCDSASK